MSIAVAAQREPVFPTTVHFTVSAAADPAALSRVVEFFALNDILPEVVRSRRFDGGLLTIDIKVRGLDDRRAGVIANKIRVSVLVFSVAVETIAIGADLADRHLRLLG